MMPSSFIHFKDGQIRHASNDGMEILGHFLLTQVGAKADFFVEVLKQSSDRELSAGPYFLDIVGNTVSLSHLENERVIPFETSRARMLDILQRWEGFCADPASCACNPQGYDLYLVRLLNDNGFAFERQLPE